VPHPPQARMPELAPYVSDEITWRERRTLYEELFAKPDTFLFLATNGDTLVGYALVHMIADSDTWTGDTWVTGDMIAELESIAVAPEHRGAGIGTKLLDAVDGELDRR